MICRVWKMSQKNKLKKKKILKTKLENCSCPRIQTAPNKGVAIPNFPGCRHAKHEIRLKEGELLYFMDYVFLS